MGYGAAGVDTFTGLLDTPDSFAGQANKLTRVNAGQTALEFAAHSKFTKTKVFDGSEATPSTWYYQPWTMTPYWLNITDGRLSGFGAIIINDNLYVFGGRYGGGATEIQNGCYKFNLTTERWTKLANLPAAAYNIEEQTSQASYNNGKIYWGVTNNQDYKKLLEYTIASDSWAVYDLPAVAGTYGKVMCSACTDNLYVVIQASAHYLYEFDYVGHGWTVKTAPPGQPRCLGKIGDEVYLVLFNGVTYKYNKAAPAWDDQSQDCPISAVGASYDEDELAMWVTEGNITGHKVYRYTPAGGWVLQFTNTRLNIEWAHCLIPREGTTKLAYFVFHFNGTEKGESFMGGAVSKYESSGAWKLLSQAFSQGDLMIINETQGVPVACELNGALRFIATGLNTICVIDTGTYLFSLSKNFDFAGVDIYRSVWG
ncbi:hypothetical protein ES703_55082 [subsurface metagenome]